MEALTSPGSTARIHAWAKGFRVSSRSEEFQIVVPADPKELEGIELRLTQEAWPTILEHLYRAPSNSIAQEFAILFDPDEVLVVSVSPSADGMQRTSLVAVCATARISWETERVAEILAKLKALVARLSTSYGAAFRGANEQARNQLRGGRFLQNRTFSLGEEKPNEDLPWAQIAAEVRKWKGIAGIATPGLCGLGANVLFGTRDDFERHRAHIALAGFFDVARGQIQTEGNHLTLWVPEPAMKSVAGIHRPRVQKTDSDRLEEIAQTLSDLKRGLEALHNGVQAGYDRVVLLLERAFKKRK
jgi:hypothetical protein